MFVCFFIFFLSLSSLGCIVFVVSFFVLLFLSSLSLSPSQPSLSYSPFLPIPSPSFNLSFMLKNSSQYEGKGICRHSILGVSFFSFFFFRLYFLGFPVCMAGWLRVQNVKNYGIFCIIARKLQKFCMNSSISTKKVFVLFYCVPLPPPLLPPRVCCANCKNGYRRKSKVLRRLFIFF